MNKLLIIDDLGEAGIGLLEKESGIEYEIFPYLKPAQLRKAAADVDGIIVNSQTALDATTLKAAKNLRVIGRTGIRVRNIDVETATRNGIMVLNTPQANAVSAAEHTLALLMATCRRIPQAHAAMSAGELADTKRWHGIDLHGKTLGIVGLGAVGRLVATRAQAFGMTVIAVDPYVSELVGRELGVTLVDLDDLLAQSDVVSLHTVVTEETLAMINTPALDQLKDGAVLINIASDRLIEPEAVAAALHSGKLAGVALDGPCLAADGSAPLIGLPNAIHTPNLATRSEEAIAAVSAEIVRNTLDALNGVAYRNVVNMAWPAGAEVAQVQPYVTLADKIGRLQAELAPAQIERVEVEISGEDMRSMVRPMAAGLLCGILQANQSKTGEPESINYVNAPFLAKESGLIMSQEYGIGEADYSNLITCRVQWRDGDGQTGSRLVAGVLFGGREPRLVQVDDYRIEARPEGTILVMANKDVPGVIGQVATLLATYNVNIAEWRLGRSGPGEEALAFINLDGEPPQAVVDALRQAPAVTMAALVNLP